MSSRGWHRRLMRLERRFPRPVIVCEGCNYPEVLLRRVVMTMGDEPIPQCPVCYRHVAHDGTPLAECVKHIILPIQGSEELIAHAS